jgi:predicted peroxiredoxin
MPRLLVQVVTGPENPTRAALGLLVARTARDGGHEVDVFFAGDAVSYLRPETRDAAHGIGTGSVREHLEALASAGATLHASGLSSKARGISAEIAGVAVALAPPARLVELVFEADRVLVY